MLGVPSFESNGGLIDRMRRFDRLVLQVGAERFHQWAPGEDRAILCALDFM